MDSEADRNLLQNLAGITGAGMQPRTIRPHNSSILNKGGNRLHRMQLTHTDLLHLHGRQIWVRNSGLSSLKVWLQTMLSLEKNETSRTNKFSTCSPCCRGFRWLLSRIRTRSLAHCRKLCRLLAVLWAYTINFWGLSHGIRH